MQMHKLNEKKLEQPALSATGIRFQPESEKEIDLSAESLSSTSIERDRQDTDVKRQAKEN